MLSAAIIFRYLIDKLDEEKSFLVDFSLDLCIDDTCEMVPIVSKLLVPIPLCNPNGTFTLPGNGSIAGVLGQLVADSSDAAIDYVLNSLGIKVKVSV